ncbi:hypothetical protein ACWCQR_05620, partial [Streptomyces sp. NPDC002172]
MRESPRATPSGTWCRTESCATSTSASCTAASEPRGAPVNDRYDAGYGSDQYELVGYDEYGQPVYRQIPAQQQQTYDPYAGQGQGQGQGLWSVPPVLAAGGGVLAAEEPLQ